MRAPLSWIRDFTPVDAPVADLVSALNQLGLEVEGVEQPGEEITGVIVGAGARRRAAPRTPTSSRWSTSTTGDGRDPRRVRRAQRGRRAWSVPYAPSGATLPGGFTLERRKIRGQVSDGMLCSAKELGLGDDHSGILGLDPAAELGADVREVLGLDDVIFDLAITPNRPDAMCIVGVARELAAHFSLDFDRARAGRARRRVGRATTSPSWSRTPARCPRYLGRVARVTMGAVARVDGAAPGEGGHAADQQRGRRHQLRAARAQPAAARVRPRRGSRAAASSCGSPTTARR